MEGFPCLVSNELNSPSFDVDFEKVYVFLLIPDFQTFIQGLDTSQRRLPFGEVTGHLWGE